MITSTQAYSPALGTQWLGALHCKMPLIMCSWHPASKGLHIFVSLHKFSHCGGTVWQAINRALFIIFSCIYSMVHKAKLMCIFPCL